MLTKLDEIMAEIETEAYFTGQALRECQIRTDFLFNIHGDIVPREFIDYVVEGCLLFEKKRLENDPS